MLATTGKRPSVAVIIVSMKADFHKKATDTITFTCTDGEKLFRAVDKAIETKEPQATTVETVGKNGGLYLAPTHVIAPEVPYENLFSLVEAAKKYGRYDQ